MKKNDLNKTKEEITITTKTFEEDRNGKYGSDLNKTNEDSTISTKTEQSSGLAKTKEWTAEEDSFTLQTISELVNEWIERLVIIGEGWNEKWRNMFKVKTFIVEIGLLISTHVAY